jgi:glycosyltransferase involved in cell wall biosynthesis
VPAGSPELTILIPLLNEEPNIEPLHRKLLYSLARLGRSWEVVFVNDGSTDRSGELIDRIAASDDRFTAVHFTRNYGQTAAFSAGLGQARGQVIVPMDGDLQNDPNDIRCLVDKIDEGYDLVSGWRKTRKDPVTKSLPSRLANRMVSSVTGVRLHDYGCSLKAYRRNILDRTYLYGEMHRFIPAYAAIAGARITEIEVGHAPRLAGKSKYGLERTLKVLRAFLHVVHGQTHPPVRRVGMSPPARIPGVAGRGRCTWCRHDSCGPGDPACRARDRRRAAGTPRGDPDAHLLRVARQRALPDREGDPQEPGHNSVSAGR